MTALGALRPGESGVITELTGDDAVTLRLLEMGLLPGERVDVLGLAPFGDPMAVRVRGVRLAIRRQDAARITLTMAIQPATTPVTTVLGVSNP